MGWTTMDRLFTLAAFAAAALAMNGCSGSRNRGVPARIDTSTMGVPLKVDAKAFGDPGLTVFTGEVAKNRTGNTQASPA